MLLAQGANGKTLTDLENALYLTTDKKETANQSHKYTELLTRSAGSVEFTIASKIYVHKTYRLLDTFSAIAVNKFGSSVAYLDFENQNKSAEIINRFIGEKSKTVYLKNVIVPKMLHPNDRFMLVNTIHFKAKWATDFRVESTRGDIFYVNETKTVTVNFMNNCGNFNYGTIDELDATALEMKFQDSNFSFMIVLPKSRTGLAALETKLKHFDLSNINQQMNEKNTHVKIPKFNITCNIDLTSILKKV